MYWQSAGGLSHVAAAHHRTATAFMEYGNSEHATQKVKVDLEEFQASILSRHSIGDAGMYEDAVNARARDFGNA